MCDGWGAYTLWYQTTWEWMDQGAQACSQKQMQRDDTIWVLATLATPCMYTNTASSPLIPLLNQQYIFIVVCAACSLSLPPYPFTTLLTNTCHLCGSKHQSRSTLGLLHRYPWPFLLGLYQDASIGITYNTHYTCSALRGSSSHSQLCLQLLQLCSNLLHCL